MNNSALKPVFRYLDFVIRDIRIHDRKHARPGQVEFSESYPYKLQEDVCVQTKIQHGKRLITENELASLDKNGLLRIKKGFIWNGANVIPDTRSNMFAALVHDALYQIMRDYQENMGDIDREEFRESADKLFLELWIKNGGGFFAKRCYSILRRAGSRYTSRKRKPPRRNPNSKPVEKCSPAQGSITCPQAEIAD